MSDTRIYKVVTKIAPDTTAAIRLVEAATQAAAIRHVVKEQIKCEVCSVVDALDLGQAGYKVECADAKEPA